LLASDEKEVVVQIAGRKRGTVILPSGTSESDALAKALKIPAVAKALGGKEPKRVVYVTGKIINIVV
jgi:leucyl-tRNA synthetase